MKNIEITAGWILGTLPSITEAVGNGKIILVVDNDIDALWINKALECLDVSFEGDIIEGEELNITSRSPFMVYWKFRIEEIRLTCPNLYAEWTRLDLINSPNKNKN